MMASCVGVRLQEELTRVVSTQVVVVVLRQPEVAFLGHRVVVPLEWDRVGGRLPSVGSSSWGWKLGQWGLCCLVSIQVGTW